MFRWQADENTLTRLVHKKDIGGFITQDAIIHPNETVVIVEDGKISDVLTQTRLKDVGGGFFNFIRKSVDKGRDMELLFADMTEKVIDITLKDRTKDFDEVDLSTQMVIQVDGRKAANLYGLTRQTPSRMITTDDLANRIHQELLPRVLTNRLRQYGSEDLGDIEVIRDLEATARSEMAKTLESWGLNLLRFTTGFGESAWTRMKAEGRTGELEGERWLEAKRTETKIKVEEIEAEESVAERSDAASMRTAERDHEAAIHRIKHDISEVETRQTGEISLADKHREFEIRDEVERTQKESVVRDIEFEQDKKEIGDLIRMKADMDKVKVERLRGEAEVETMKFRETTYKAKELDADVEKHRAAMEAEKAKYQLDLYERAQDKASEAELKRLEMFQKTVESSKAATPQTLVQTSAPPTTVVGISASDKGKGSETTLCPNCGAAVPAAATVCMKCGQKFGT